MKTNVERAIELLKQERILRKVYDYDLRQLISAIEAELAKRDEKRAGMINCLQDMCRWLQENGETEYTFYYSAQHPQELMESENDEVTDDGFDKICQQIDGKKILTFEHDGKVFRIKSQIDLEEGKGQFELEEILSKVEKTL